MQGTVRVIKAKDKKLDETQIENSKLRVAAYCRVSTDDEEQLNSFTSQLKYYKNKINKNKDWTFVNIYSDESITGTKADVRVGFQNMIKDCLDGKIDLILTKSISRFARNTVDTLNYVRQLKLRGIGIMFEEEKINTLTMDGELLLTILSSVAQQEVQNISANVKKGLKMKLQRGELIGCPLCYGYDYDPKTKKLIINRNEADIVKYIYTQYLLGCSIGGIAKNLVELGVTSKKGNKSWDYSTIFKMLKNEKYKGDILFGKTYTMDPISKKRVANDGVSDQFYFENHHDAIIDKETWQKVQDKINENKLNKKNNKTISTNGKYAMSYKIVCGCCGEIYYRRTASQTRNATKIVWKCKNRIVNGATACKHSKTVDEDAIIKAFTMATNILISEDSNLLTDFAKTVRLVLNENHDMEKIKKLEISNTALQVQKDKLLDMYLDNMLSQEDYNTKIANVLRKIEVNKEKINELSVNENDKENLNLRIAKMINRLKQETSQSTFDPEIFNELINKVVVGAMNESGEFEPNTLTFVYNTDINNQNRNKNYTIISSFICDYDFGGKRTLTRDKENKFLVNIAVDFI